MATLIEIGGVTVDAEEMLFEIERAQAEDSLAEFIRQAWHVIEPGQEYIHGWHIDVICEHLEAITDGHVLDDGTPYNRLLINVPPGFSKSIITGVFWPAWEWGPRNMPHMRYVCAAHSQDLAIRDGLRMRRLITSEWYQKRWGDRVVLTGDQNQKTKFENTATGFRQASASGSITGSRGDRVICFPYEEIVHTENGPVSIGDLVNAKTNVRVWSSPPGSGQLELRPITGWHKNPGSDILEVVLSDGTSFHCTPDHKVWTSDGWVPAGMLSSGHMIPRHAVSDCPDSSRAHSVFSSKRPLRSFGPINRKNVRLGKSRPTGALAPAIVAALQLAGRKLFPSFSASDLLNSVSLHAKSLRENISGFFACGNYFRRLSGQNGSRPVLVYGERPMTFGVSDVLGARPVLKIDQSGVIPLSIFVPNLLPGRRRADEDQHNKLMNKKLFRSAVPAGVKPRISFRHLKPQNALRYLQRPTTTTFDNARFAPNATQVAYAIKSLVSGDRFPVFVRKVGHRDETFCISVEGNNSFFVGRGKGVLVSNCDDPLSVDGANSDAVRESTKRWFLEAVPTRLNNPKTSAIIVIMQRLHEDDISGVIISKGLGYDHIMLPMMYDPARAAPTMLGIEDPRCEEGELLFPARFPQEVVERDSRAMGPYATAGQFQQSPEPRGGGIIKREWWQLWDEGAYPPMDYVIASLDTAYTTKQENDFSAMTVWGVFTGATTATIKKEQAFDGEWTSINGMIEREYEQRSPSVMLMTAWQDKLPLHELVEKVAATCRRMGVDKLLIEDKAAGHSVAQEIRRLYGHEDWMVQLVNPGNIDKMARLYSVQHLFAEGMIHAPDRTWSDLVINQCATFPRAKNDDLVDTAAQALRHMREIGLLARAPEIRADISSEIRHDGGRHPPLYPV